MADKTYFRINIIDFRCFLYEERPYETSYVIIYLGKKDVSTINGMFSVNEEVCFQFFYPNLGHRE